MKSEDDYHKDVVALDHLIEKITVDAYTHDEQLWAFRQVIKDKVSFPREGRVIGEPITVIGMDYDGNERRGLTAKCRRTNGTEYIVAASDVVLSGQFIGDQFIASYRRWLGIEPFPTSRKSLKKETPADLCSGESVELVVFSTTSRTARCRILENDPIVTLRVTGLWDAIPGEIVVVRPRKWWRYAGHPYLSGVIESVRLDVSALRLVPLKLKSFGTWDPEEHYWGEEGDPIEDWAKPIIARGPRQEFEMEQILPGVEPDDFDSDPICESNDLKAAGDHGAALKILMDLCRVDLRCLDAHSHLGNFCFEKFPEMAIRHYEIGFRIGELSLGADFDGVLEWGLIDNRPFLRCMHGYGLCLWRLERFTEAEQIFDRMLWLNPSDNQGVRFVIDDVKAGIGWREDG